MDKRSVLDKIRKLKALASGDADVNESAAAAAMAQKLITRHQLHEAELLIDGEFPDDLVEGKLESSSMVVQNWQLSLAQALAEHNYCRVLIRPGKRPRGGVRLPAVLSLLGSKANVTTVHYLYEALAKDIEALCKAGLRCGEGSGRQWAASFRLGAVFSVRRRLTAVVQRERQAAKIGTLEKLDEDYQRIEEWLTNKQVKTRERKAPTVDEDGYLAGLRAGQKLDLFAARKSALASPKKGLEG